ncbi:hypothetical protein F4779DRAFT_320603 [Xylariaceae sp. FL0662B]|nr:hypothetical protein F4779DRAFT_320603 [Xylariaceae sp. FL0662B]
MALDSMAARLLVSDLVTDRNYRYGFSSMTYAFYDTAWISMIRKPTGCTHTWLFPASFDFLLRTQKPTGGWGSPAAELDSILNTAAGLLALSRHREPAAPSDLDSRISAATGFLLERLQELDLSVTLSDGFELLLPALLDLLDGEGIPFVFPARQALLEIRDQKLACVDVESVYAGAKSTILHSLEAFIGRVDFDRLAQHKAHGSVMASPSSTAAYLMNVSIWDDETEEYLRYVMAKRSGKGDGCMPSAFPSTLFELSWVVSMLLENGFRRNDLGARNTEVIRGILLGAFDLGSGLVGFAPFLEPDADNTARGSITLNLLGVPTTSAPLIKEFSNNEYTRTYTNESDPSISTNSNVLISLCVGPDVVEHAPQIETVMRFLCKNWWRDPDGIREKWNKSPYYSLMLMAQALKRALDAWARNVLSNLPLDLLQDSLVVLFQILLRLLRAQRQDGSWDGERESTAYSIIAINSVASLPVARPIMSGVDFAIQIGRRFLFKNQNSSLPPEHLWIEKVMYGSYHLSQAFTLAALKGSVPESPVQILDLLPKSLECIVESSNVFRRLPMFSKKPEWHILASLIEGALFRRRLESECFQAFPKRQGSEENHFSFVPFTWAAGNSIHGRPLGPDKMLDMMVISALAYQVDDFIENEVATLPTGILAVLRLSIGRLFAEVESEESACKSTQKESSPEGNEFKANDYILNSEVSNDNRNNSAHISTQVDVQEGIERVCRTLKRFICYLWRAPYVRVATEYNKAQLKLAVQDFLVAHIAKIEDSRLLAAQPPPRQGMNKIFLEARSSLFDWTHTTSGVHPASPFAIWAFVCMLGHGEDCLGSPQAKYIVQGVVRHLSAFCRLYNDIGSMLRDYAENNLNSTNFPEFGSEVDAHVLKDKLLCIAKYERRCLDAAMAELRPLVDVSVHASLSVFCSTAYIYGEMCILKDLTPDVRPQAASPKIVLEFPRQSI